MEKKKRETAKHTDQEQPTTAATDGNEQAAPVEPETELRHLEEALAAKTAEAAENWDKFVRERADLENYRRRVQKEKEEILKYGNESLLLEILPAVDNMERALDHVAEDSQDPVIAGVRMTLDMLLAALKKFGVTTVESAPGVAFDPAVHQAMGQVECAGQETNTVVQVYQKGYLLNERLLRPAMVSVACAPK